MKKTIKIYLIWYFQGRRKGYWLTPIALARSVGYNAPELRHLRELVEEHCELFKEKWDECFRD